MKSTDNPQPTVDEEEFVTFQSTRETLTRAVPDFVDLTELVEDAVVESGIVTGRVTVFAPEATCSLMVNERESGLLADLQRTMERLEPKAGLHPVIGSSSVVLPIEDGTMRLGRWQRVLLVELTAASPRSVSIQVIGRR